MKWKMGETNDECEARVEERSNTQAHDTWMGWRAQTLEPMSCETSSCADTHEKQVTCEVYRFTPPVRCGKTAISCRTILLQKLTSMSSTSFDPTATTKSWKKKMDCGKSNVYLRCICAWMTFAQAFRHLSHRVQCARWVSAARADETSIWQLAGSTGLQTVQIMGSCADMDATFGIDEKGLVLVVLLQILGGDGFITVTAVRKSGRSLIGAFLPDLFSEIYQFFRYLSYSSEDGQ